MTRKFVSLRRKQWPPPHACTNCLFWESDSVLSILILNTYTIPLHSQESYFWSVLLVNCLQTVGWMILKKRILTPAQVLKSWFRWLLQIDLPKHLDVFTTSVRSCKASWCVCDFSKTLIFFILYCKFLLLILYICKSYWLLCNPSFITFFNFGHLLRPDGCLIALPPIFRVENAIHRIRSYRNRCIWFNKCQCLWGTRLSVNHPLPVKKVMLSWEY